jgi:iron(III) transport system ATP-binding protein
MSAISIFDLHKSFRESPVLLGLELQVEKGSLTAILGPSGSGKTTLLRLIAGLERADRGRISLAEQVVDDGDHYIKPEARRVGYVPQDGSLFPHLTVAQNIGFGLSRALRRDGRVGSLIQMVGLEGLGGRYPHQLSGGQQQRVALARALAIEPQLLLLDEPFSALDPTLRAAVRDEVGAILAATGITTLLVTHDQEEALSVADQVAVLRGGRVAQLGSPEQLYSDPVDLDMARFLGDANLVDGIVEGGVARTPLGPMKVRPPRHSWVRLAGPAIVLVRPEQITITAAGAPGVPGKIVRWEFYGHDSVVAVASQLPQLPGIIRVRIWGAPRWERDATVTLSASGEAQAWPKLGPRRLPTSRRPGGAH